MLLSEAEAKTKWCPNRPLPMSPADLTFDTYNCVASRCMAWRWKWGASPDDVQRNQARGAGTKEALGFCGLAVTPLEAR